MSAVILEKNRFEITLRRLCHELIEHHDDFRDTVLIGLQPKGIYLARNLHKRLEETLKHEIPFYGELDITFYRDDFRHREKQLIPSETDLDFQIEGKKVVLIDDVVFTGRSVRAALDALVDFGRPAKVEFLTLIDRRFSRQLPVEPDYIGMSVDSRSNEKVLVQWEMNDQADQVWLISLNQKQD